MNSTEEKAPKWLRNMSDEELKKLFLSLYQTVEILECFGTHDVLELAATQEELLKRGYEIRPGMPTIVKAESEEDEE